MGPAINNEQQQKDFWTFLWGITDHKSSSQVVIVTKAIEIKTRGADQKFYPYWLSQKYIHSITEYPKSC